MTTNVSGKEISTCSIVHSPSMLRKNVCHGTSLHASPKLYHIVSSTLRNTILSDTIDLLCEVLVRYPVLVPYHMTLCLFLCFVVLLAQNGVWKIYRLSSFFFRSRQETKCQVWKSTVLNEEQIYHTLRRRGYVVGRQRIIAGWSMDRWNSGVIAVQTAGGTGSLG